MSEKRFEFEWDMNISDNLTGKEYDLHCDEAFEFIKIINDIVEKNEQLKEQLKQQEMEYVTEHHYLAEENRQLKSEIKMLRWTIGRNEKYIADLTQKSKWSN